MRHHPPSSLAESLGARQQAQSLGQGVQGTSPTIGDCGLQGQRRTNFTKTKSRIRLDDLSSPLENTQHLYTLWVILILNDLNIHFCCL